MQSGPASALESSVWLWQPTSATQRVAVPTRVRQSFVDATENLYQRAPVDARCAIENQQRCREIIGFRDDEASSLSHTWTARRTNA